MQLNQHSVLKLVICSLAIGSCLASTAIAQEQPPPPPIQREEPPKIIRKSGGVLQGSATRRVEPAYPPLARAAQVSGAVVVEVTVDEEGNVISARAISGHPLLKDAAVEAARGWTFSPTTLQGVPVKVIGTITFNFTLGDGSSDQSNEIEKLKERIAATPNAADLYVTLGKAYVRNSQVEDALEAYHRALQLKSDYPEALYEIGCAYERLSRFEQATEALKRALAIKPDDAAINLELASVYLKTDRENEALEAAREVLKSNPSFVQADASYAAIGFVLVKQGRFPEAIEALKQGAALGPKQDHFHLYLGNTYAAAGDKDSAMAEYKYLKERNPKMAQELLEFMKNFR